MNHYWSYTLLMGMSLILIILQTGLLKERIDNRVLVREGRMRELWIPCLNVKNQSKNQEGEGMQLHQCPSCWLKSNLRNGEMIIRLLGKPPKQFSHYLRSNNRIRKGRKINLISNQTRRDQLMHLKCQNSWGKRARIFILKEVREMDKVWASLRLIGSLCQTYQTK